MEIANKTVVGEAPPAHAYAFTQAFARAMDELAAPLLRQTNGSSPNAASDLGEHVKSREP